MSPHPSCSQQPPAGAEEGLVPSTYIQQNQNAHTPNPWPCKRETQCSHLPIRPIQTHKGDLSAHTQLTDPSEP